MLRGHKHASAGQALVETALVVPLLLVITLGVVGIGRLTQTQMAVSAVAREAARSGALQDNQRDAHDIGVQRGYDVGQGYNLRRPPLKVDVDASKFGRCGSVTASVSYPLDLSDLPLIGVAQFTLQSSHTEPVDGYRSQVTSQVNGALC